MKKLKLTKDVKMILETLNTYGHGYIVGGYIRDVLLGKEPKDCDFCTDIPYDKLKEIFKKYRPNEVGKTFGIIQIRVRGKIFDIAKMRKDISYGEARNIAEIEFIQDIKEDLERRDFTVNSIAYDGKNIIYVSNIAKEDIRRRRLRFVGDGSVRIVEDPLRILRGIRIAAKSHLEIIPKTLREMYEGRNEVKKLSVERIKDEVFKMLRCDSSRFALDILIRTGSFEAIFDKKIYEDEQEIIETYLRFLDKKFPNEVDLKLAAIFWDYPEGLDTLKLAKARKASIENIKESFSIVGDLKSRYEIKKLVSKIGLEDYRKTLVLKSVVENVRYQRREIENILDAKEPIFTRDLEISGKDVIEAGIKKNEDIGRILNEILDMVQKNPSLNKRDYLLNKILEV